VCFKKLLIVLSICLCTQTILYTSHLIAPLGLREVNLPTHLTDPRNVTESEELIDILYPETGIRTGETVTREAAHAHGLWHRAVHFWY